MDVRSSPRFGCEGCRAIARRREKTTRPPDEAGGRAPGDTTLARRSGRQVNRYEAVEASSEGPSNLAEWAEFHEQIGKLPEKHREIFDLLLYQGLTHQQAAELLECSERTVKRHWREARRQLHAALGGESTSS